MYTYLMADEIYLGNTTYVSSKRAAKEYGYAQDYVGQLARGGVIDAQRVGGLWYVNPASLEAYKRNAEAYVPKIAESSIRPPEAADTLITFDGKDYVSAAKAARLTGYNPDYVGQLARAGKVLSRQIGNRWYVERDGLLAHKAQKDALLANVQAESVGLVRPVQPAPAPQKAEERPVSFYTYSRDEKHLMPVMNKPQPTEDGRHAATDVNVGTNSAVRSTELEVLPNTVPIRIVQTPVRASVAPRAEAAAVPLRRGRTSGMTKSLALKAGVALTVVIVMSYGFASIKSESLYAMYDAADLSAVETMTANAASGLDALLDLLEAAVSNEVHYSR